jgi:zinc protease
MLEEMRGMAAGGPSAEELEIARDHLTGSFPLRIETNRQIGAALLDGVRHGRGLDYVDRYRDRIRAITREEVKAASARLFRAADAIVVTAGTRVV